ncbi:MAG: hypothetical protein HYV40_00535 [Candidatus Levybacteria bacterium]|nr:hypothetical protein [Candidatus Levybacteria bacterium]
MTEAIEQRNVTASIEDGGLAIPHIHLLRPSQHLVEDIHTLHLDELVMTGYGIDDPAIDPSN